jgi:hypothetical protein
MCSLPRAASPPPYSPHRDLVLSSQHGYYLKKNFRLFCTRFLSQVIQKPKEKHTVKIEYVLIQISYLSFCPEPITRILTRTTCFFAKVVYILLNAHSYEK